MREAIIIISLLSFIAQLLPSTKADRAVGEPKEPERSLMRMFSRSYINRYTSLHGRTLCVYVCSMCFRFTNTTSKFNFYVPSEAFDFICPCGKLNAQHFVSFSVAYVGKGYYSHNGHY